MTLTRPDASQIAYEPPLFVRDRLERIIFPEQYGAVGDGTTASALAIQAALDAAGTSAVVMFKPGGIYQIDNNGVDFPEGCRVITNGAVLRASSTSTTNAQLFNVAENSQIDHLNVEIPTGIRRDRVVVFGGPDIVVGKVTVISTDQQSLGTDSNDTAVRFVGCDRLRAGTVRVENYERAVSVESTSDANIGSLIISSYIRGLYLLDCINTRIGASTITVASPNATNTPGHVGVLAEASADDATRNVWIEDFVVEDAGEHGIRLGGDDRISNFWIVRPAIKNCGASGIKVLGDSTLAVSPNYHERIYVTDAVIEDSGSGTLNDNMDGIYFCFVVDGNITNPVIRKQGKTNSAYHGILIQNSVDVDIVNPQIYDTEEDGIRIDGQFEDIDRLIITDGKIVRSGGHGINFTYDAGTFRRIIVNRTLIEGSTGTGVTVSANAGTGTVSLCRVDAIFGPNNAGGNMACDSANVSLMCFGTFVSVTCADGSQWNDFTTINYRKAGAWSAL